MRLTLESLSLPRAIAPDLEIVAIGDIHGRPDLLDALIEAAAATPRRAAVRHLVFTGDLVDRGPDSLGALQLAREAAGRIGAQETLGLLGNHEILMRMTLDPTTPMRHALGALEVWLRNGGDAVVEQLIGDASWGEARQLLSRLRQATPAPVAAWLSGLRPHHRCGDVLFVHAGVHPAMPLDFFLAVPWDTPLDRIDESAHWAWIRAPFLNHRPDARGFSGYLVVHGHSPLDRGYTAGHAEQARRFRLNLDGGSAMTGQAKMAILCGGMAEIVTAHAPAPRAGL
jgi:serine/threonine protein phosphatase 1